MIELFFIYLLCQQIGDRAREKRRRGWPYKVLAVVLWIGCEVVGTFVGFGLHRAMFGEPETPFFSLGWVIGILFGATAGTSVLGVLRFRSKLPLEVRLVTLPGLPRANGNRAAPPAWRQEGATGYLAYLPAGGDTHSYTVLCFSGVSSFDYQEHSAIPREGARGFEAQAVQRAEGEQRPGGKTRVGLSLPWISIEVVCHGVDRAGDSVDAADASGALDAVSAGGSTVQLG
ncbi:hypothetical protein ABI59_00260 [Acidobacteria bacterium Mor1]|nr:hypothetical protein ABI59_00260 [Acidobacteria bacterium Mor1]